MLKKMSLCIALCLGAIVVFAQDDFQMPTIQSLGLKGQVKSFTEYYYIQKGDTIEKAQYGTAEHKIVQSFNTKGQLTQFASFTAEGGLVEKRIIQYNAEGNLAKVEIELHGYAETEPGKWEVMADLTNTMAYSYDSDQNMVRYLELEDGNPLFDYRFSYKKIGDKTVVDSIKMYSSASTQPEITVAHSYTPKGLLSKKIEYDRFSGLTNTYNYTYDANGNKIKESIGNGDQSVERNFDNKLITSEINDNADGRYQLKFDYNSNNDPVKITITSGSGIEEVKNSYQYDSTKNWLRLATVHPQGTEVRKRELSYYSTTK